MPIPEDVLAAKRVVSERLLRPIAVASAPAAFELSVASAVESASDNVHAVGVGKKRVEGRDTPVPAVRIYVAQKLPLSLIPPGDRLPSEIDGIPTDVIESPRALVMATPACSLDRQRRQRPILGGISTAHTRVTAGTLSCVCRSTAEGDDPEAVFVLSNNHVFADVNRGSPGDSLLQPGPLDGGVAGDEIAELHRFVRIALGGSTPNRVDAAIGRLLDGVPFLADVCTIGAITGTTQAVEDMPVRKHGRTSGYTEGEVTDESYDAIVGMDHHDSSVVALFQGQFRVERTLPFPAFGLGGDSGSLVVRRDAAEAVGLYFAGPPSGSYGIANHIAAVLDELQITLA
jgi:hypothetical protein